MWIARDGLVGHDFNYGNGSWSKSSFQTEELVVEVWIIQKLLARAVENRSAVFDNIGAIDEVEASVNVLLEQKDCHALV